MGVKGTRIAQSLEFLVVTSGLIVNGGEDMNDLCIDVTFSD